MKTLIKGLLVCIICFFLNASMLNSQQVEIKSPSTMEFIRYGNTPVKLYTGQTDVSLELFNIKDGDLRVNGSIIYNSAGFRPNLDDGELGINWNFLCGGVITRTVHGYPDESQLGLFQLIQDGVSFSPEDIKNGVIPNSNFDIPDIFHFSFLGKSGTFISDYNGGFKVRADEHFVIEYFHYYPNVHNISASYFKIIDNEGYEYYFGFEGIRYLDNREFTLPFNPSGRDDDNGSLTSWYITKIISPTNQEIEFIYKRYVKNYDVDHAMTSADRILLRRFNDYEVKPSSFAVNSSNVVNTFNGIPFFSNLVNANLIRQLELKDVSGSSFYAFSNKEFEQVLRKPILERIVSNNFVVNFYHGVKNRKFYENVYGIDISKDPYNYKLDSIHITNTNSEFVRKINFQHQYLGGNEFKRFFLTDLTINDRNYSFDYWKTELIPNPYEAGVDHWGFYNGLSSLAGAPEATMNYFGEFSLAAFGSRRVDTLYYKVGLLKEINYPTGGYSSFLYEPHDYYKIKLKRKENGFIPDFYENNGFAGGARIKTIIHSDNFGESIVKQYYYRRGFDASFNSQGSSGILGGFPIYYLLEGYYNDIHLGLFSSAPDLFSESNLRFKIHASSNEFFSFLNVNENYIVYSEVVELEKNNGYSVFYFSNPLSHPDLPYNNNARIRPINTGQNEFYYYTLYNQHLIGTSRSFERGKIVKQEIISLDGELLKQNFNNFNIDENKFELAGFFYDRVTLFGYAWSSFLFRDQISKAKESIINKNSDEIVRTNEYSYNQLGLLESNKEFVNIDKELKIIYRYPFDFDLTSLLQYCNNQRSSCYANAQLEYIDCRANCYDQQFRDICLGDCLDFLNYEKEQCDLQYNNCISSFSDEVKALIRMQDKNMISQPIEVIKKLNDKVVESNLREYKIDSYNNVNLSKVYQLENESPVPEQSFVSSSIDQNGNFVKDNLYKSRSQVTRYDNRGNILEYIENELKNSFIWGYGRQYPIASVINASSNSIAYTSFENGQDLGNWQPSGGTMVKSSTAKTGQYYLNMYSDQAIQFSAVEPGIYRLEFWAKSPVTITGGTVTSVSSSSPDANGWILYVKELNISSPTYISLGGITHIDELRLYPKGAQMTSYTYEPLFGMTSQTDPNGLTTYYEYDGLGRLIKVLDKDRNVLQEYKYNYANQ